MATQMNNLVRKLNSFRHSNVIERRCDNFEFIVENNLNDITQCFMTSDTSVIDLESLVINSGFLQSVVYTYLQSCLSRQLKDYADKDEPTIHYRGGRGRGRGRGRDKMHVYQHKIEDDGDLNDLVWNQSSSRILRLTIELIALMCERSLKSIEDLEQIIDRIGVILRVLNDEILTDLFKMTVLRHKTEFLEKEQKFNNHAHQPEDFRYMPLIPNLSEIKSTRDLYLRPNLKHGAFENVGNYLDIHFRLLREDYVGSIRDGLIEYLNVQRNQRNKSNYKNIQNIRVYKNVKILNSVTDNQSIVHLIGFEITDQMERIRWETSKRLIDGSLLCFSNDNFITAYFATVFDRYAPDLYEGKVIVKFDDWISLNNNINNYNNDFIMIESLAYFESYRHTLESLKSFDESNFPFKKHIVYSQNDFIDIPQYLKIQKQVFYDFRPIIQNSFKVEILKDDPGYYTQRNNIFVPDEIIKRYIFNNFDYSLVNIVEQRLWPSADLLGLDSSQYEAIKLALTNELVVIQGPPGTGKTYIGVEVIKMLLHNYDKISPIKPKSKKWNPNESNNPILIVCYTNHALDQILMLVSKFLNEGVDEVVRIGGRSKEDKLIGANLKNMRSCYRHFREFPPTIVKTLTKERGALKSLISSINFLLNLLNDSTMNILDFSEVSKMCNYKVFDSLFDNTVRRFYDVENLSISIQNRIFRDWLGAGNLENWFNRKNVIDSIAYFNASFYDNHDDNALNDAFEGMNIRDSEDEIEEESNDVNEQFDAPKVKIYDDQYLKENHVAEEAEIINQFRQVDEDIEKKINIRQLLNDGSNSRYSKFRKFKYQKSSKKNDNSNFELLWHDRRKAREKRLFELLTDTNSHLEMSEYDVNTLINNDLWQLNPHERLMFYKYFINKYRDRLNNKLSVMREEYAFNEAELQKARDIESLYLLRHAKIIGCTTTGAAKNQSLLQLVKPKVVIAEEAAEVFESHIVTCLTQSCEQLILIGDNEQLCPKPNLYKLETDYNLNVSLFERLVNNKIPKVRLDLQHRMRPEISFLMKYFYENLIDADSVMNYDHVNGIQKDLFFIQHENMERGVEDSLSKANLFEAEYITRLCDYLIKQGYKPDQITVLVAYGGQLLTCKNQVTKLCNNNKRIHPGLKDVRITPIDNYQGEENDIILLSLVRSNKNNSIGFLAVSNRVCVALSRAKKGFYVIADFNHLASNSKLWSNIVDDAKSRDMIGNTLNVVCKKHHKVTEIRKPEDFDLCPDGGCLETCDESFDCGHLCDIKCHALEHSHFNCIKPCERLYDGCSLNHKCNQLCFEKCQNCNFDVEKFLPKCGHTVITKCSIPIESVNCNIMINMKLECGHFKDIECYKQQEYQNCLADPLNSSEVLKQLNASTLRCDTIVENFFEDCNHKENIFCHLISAKTVCKTKISKLMPKCGHFYDVECSRDQSLLECKAKIEVQLSCNHTASIECSKMSASIINDYKCQIEKEIIFKCGHETKTLCHQTKSAKCQKDCNYILKCGHRCLNKCGQCWNNKHSICNKKCNKMLVCGHLCSLNCSVPCYTCNEKCSIKCAHRSCSRKCSEFCGGQCIKKCPWSCEHNIKCDNPCNDYCNPQRCNVKCDRVLECKHKCQSMCGETCICAKCNVIPLDETKTYIKLDNCNCIVTVEEMDKHMMIEQYRLKLIQGFPICPKFQTCGKPIYYSKRYASIIQLQQEKLSNLKILSKFNKKSTKRQFFISHQSFHFPLQAQIKIDEYMRKMNSNLQLTFVENRVRLLNFHNKNIINRFNFFGNYLPANIIIEEILETPIEIPNEKAEELGYRLLACYYYYALNQTKKHKAIASKIEKDFINREPFTKSYFSDILGPIIDNEASINFEIISLNKILFPIEDIYSQINYT